MEYKEALDILCKGIAPNPIKNNECIELCKKAVSMQVPMKVQKAYDYMYDRRCPVCGNFLESIEFVNPDKYKHCEQCGQAVSWDNE